MIKKGVMREKHCDKERCIEGYTVIKKGVLMGVP